LDKFRLLGLVNEKGQEVTFNHMLGHIGEISQLDTDMQSLFYWVDLISCLCETLLISGHFELYQEGTMGAT